MDDSKGALNIAGVYSETEPARARDTVSSQNFQPTLLDSLPLAIFIKDCNGRYLACNAQLSKLLGIDEQDLLGKTVFDLQPAESAAFVHEKDCELLEQGGTQSHEGRLLHKQSGCWIDVLYHKSLVYKQGSMTPAIVGVLVDCTEQRAREESIEKSRKTAENMAEQKTSSLALIEKMQNIILKLSTSEALMNGDLNRYFQEATAHTAEVLEVEQVGVWLYSGQDRELLCSHDVYNRKQSTHRRGTVVDLRTMPNYRKALDTGRGLSVHDARNDPRTAEFPDWYILPQNIYSMLNSPIRSKGAVTGVLSIEHTDAPRRWRVEEIHFAAAVADQLTHALLTYETLESKAELEVRQKYLGAILDNSPFLMWLKDAQGRYLAVNKPFVQACGCNDSTTIVGKTDEELWPPSLAERFKLHDMQATLSRAALHTEEMASLEGNTVWIESFRTPIIAGDQRLLGLTGCSRDITLRKESEEQLRAAKAMAEEHAKAKNQFLAKVSHELRTPMNGVLGMAELLSETPLSLDQTEMVSLMQASTEALLSVVNDILDFSKIEAGKMQLSPAPFSMEPLLERTAALFGSQIEKKKIVLLVEAAPSVPKTLLGDQARLRQIVTNLLGNALKFTPPEGAIIVLCECEGVSAAGEASIHLGVSDSGIGIPENELETIFQAFRQVDDSYTRQYGGTGLGLAITKQIVELMGGAIRARSKVGVGSSFRVNMTLPVVENTPMPDSPISGALLKRGPWRALVVEDNPANQTVARVMLQRLGFEVTVTENGDHAIAAVLAQSMPFDIIFMDLQMPVLDGLSATKKLRLLEGKECTHTPIIGVTAHGREEDRARCLDAGMDDWIVKPLRFADLQAAIRRWVKDGQD